MTNKILRTDNFEHFEVYQNEMDFIKASNAKNLEESVIKWNEIGHKIYRVNEIIANIAPAWVKTVKILFYSAFHTYVKGFFLLLHAIQHHAMPKSLL